MDVQREKRRGVNADIEGSAALIRSQSMAAGNAWLDQRITAGKLRGESDPELLRLIANTRELIRALGDISSSAWFVDNRDHLRTGCWRASMVLSTLVNAKLQRAKELAGDSLTLVVADHNVQAVLTCPSVTDARDAMPTMKVQAVASG